MNVEKIKNYFYAFICFVALLIGTFLIVQSSLIKDYVNKTIENLKFIPDTILINSQKRIAYKPYVAFFITKEDKKIFGCDSRLFINNLDFFSKPSSLRTIFFISCKLSETKSYNTTQTKSSGPIKNTTYGSMAMSSYGVYVWVYDLESKTFISLKYFNAIPLRESYTYTNANTGNNIVPDSSVKEYINSFFVSDSN
jgi:hypothetical protein